MEGNFLIIALSHHNHVGKDIDLNILFCVPWSFTMFSIPPLGFVCYFKESCHVLIFTVKGHLKIHLLLIWNYFCVLCISQHSSYVLYYIFTLGSIGQSPFYDIQVKQHKCSSWKIQCEKRGMPTIHWIRQRNQIVLWQISKMSHQLR